MGDMGDSADLRRLRLCYVSGELLIEIADSELQEEDTVAKVKALRQWTLGGWWCLSNSRGIPMECLWNAYGMPMECLRNVYGRLKLRDLTPHALRGF